MNGSYKPGDSVTAEFITSVFATGAVSDADSLPAGTLNVDGTDNGATVTVAKIDTGRYKATFTIPATLTAGQDCILTIAATVSSVASKAVVWSTRLGVGVIRSNTAAAGAAGSITLDGSATTTLNYYKGMWVVILAGTGLGQCRQITAYSTGRVATVVPNWITNPSTDSIFVILASGGMDVEMINASATAAVQQARAANDVRPGTCTSTGSTTTLIDSQWTAGTYSTASLQGRTVIWITGLNAGQKAQITAHTAGSGTLTTELMSNIPQVGDTYDIY